MERDATTKCQNDPTSAAAQSEENRWARLQRWVMEWVDCRDCIPQPLGLKRSLCYVARLSDAYLAHQCSLMACACAYCGLFSTVPLLIVGIAALGFVAGGSGHALNNVIHEIRGFVPINPNFLRAQLQHILQDRHVIGVFGIVSLIYSAHLTFLSLMSAMNMIFVVPETRHWIRGRLISLGVAFLTLILLAVDLAASTLAARVDDLNLPRAIGYVAALFSQAGLEVLPLLVMTLLFTLLYRILPAHKVPWKSALLGAGVAALLWEALKFAFRIFLLYSSGYGRLYGSISGLVILVVWIYYSMAILLLGAEIAADHEAMKFSLREAQRRAHSGADLAAAAHRREQPPPPPKKKRK